MASSQPPPSAKPATAATTGLRAAAARCQFARKIAEKDLGELLVGHLLDVGAGRERLVRAGDHDAADIGVGLEAHRSRESSSCISALLSALSA